MHGRVQGVGFRYHARREAQRLGVCGWIRNRSCGRRVEMTVSGTGDAVASALEWCSHGPPHARVERVELLDGPAEDPGTSFEILPTH